MNPLSREPGIAMYLRVNSREVQNVDQLFYDQRQHIRQSLAQTGSDLPVVAEYTDNLSATDNARPGYRQMLHDARQGKFSHLAVSSVDRLSRGIIETHRLLQELLDMGILVILADAPDLEISVPSRDLMVGIQAAIAQYDLERRIQFANDARLSILLQGGWPGKLPDGYKRVSDPQIKSSWAGQIVLDPDRARMWREAWDLLLTGEHTLKQICQELHKRGYTRKSGKPWAWTKDESGDKRFAYSILRDSFNRAFYAGWVVSEAFGIVRGDVRGSWEPIVTDAEFDGGISILRRYRPNASDDKGIVINP